MEASLRWPLVPHASGASTSERAFTNPASAHNSHRTDIDGLRGIAVLSVVLFHEGISRLSGGYVGVDVFFVISGYLITGILLRQIHNGDFTIAQFYERRIRRIFPALFLTIAVCIVAGLVLLVPASLKELADSIVA